MNRIKLLPVLTFSLALAVAFAKVKFQFQPLGFFAGL
jgi:hypothetical protein